MQEPRLAKHLARALVYRVILAEEVAVYSKSGAKGDSLGCLGKEIKKV